MTIPILNQNNYYKTDMNNVLNNDKSENLKVNDLKSIYMDSSAISELSLKSAHTSEILSQRVKDIHESRSLKNVDFEKESTVFDKSNIQAMNGDFKTSQANISSKSVMELLK